MEWKESANGFKERIKVEVVKTSHEAYNFRCPLCRKPTGFFRNKHKSLLVCISCRIYIPVEIEDEED